MRLKLMLSTSLRNVGSQRPRHRSQTPANLPSRRLLLHPSTLALLRQPPSISSTIPGHPPRLSKPTSLRLLCAQITRMSQSPVLPIFFLPLLPAVVNSLKNLHSHKPPSLRRTTIIMNTAMGVLSRFLLHLARRHRSSGSSSPSPWLRHSRCVRSTS